MVYTPTTSIPVAAPDIEVTLRSPLGEVRVWLAPEGADDAGMIRASLRIEYGDEADTVRTAADMARVVARLGVAVRGLASGETAPAVSNVVAATLAPWLAERTEADPTARTLIRHLHQDYLAWCDRQGLPGLPLREFGNALSERGFTHAGLITQGGFKGRSRGGIRIRMAAAAGAEVAQ